MNYPVKLRILLGGIAAAAILALAVPGPLRAAEKGAADLKTAALKAGAPRDWVSASLPALLNEADAARYRIVFELQKNGEWKDADKIIERIDDRATEAERRREARRLDAMGASRWRRGVT